jgi:hypothetical protein
VIYFLRISTIVIIYELIKNAVAMRKSQTKILLGASIPLTLLHSIAIRCMSGVVVCAVVSAFYSATSFATAQDATLKPAQKLAQNAGAVKADAVATVTEPIKVSLVRKKIVVKAGVETFENADVVKPGDVIEESAMYKNVSDKVISKFLAQLPVPSNTELIANSTKPNAALASLDGAQYAPIPLKRATTAPANSTQGAQAPLLPVPLSEYRYLRWAQDEIIPGKTITVSARFRVLGNNLLNSVTNTQLNNQPTKNDVTTNTNGANSALGAIGIASSGANK